MIDWGKAPEGAMWWVNGCAVQWYKVEEGGLQYWDNVEERWDSSLYTSLVELHEDYPTATPRPTAPKPYTRDEALLFLVERLDTWPTGIADAPLCPGWGWRAPEGCTPVFDCVDYELHVFKGQWSDAVNHKFRPFISVEDAQPAPDMVNHPPHYQSDTGVECIDAIRAALDTKGFQAYCIGNTMKYLWREKSDKAEDLRKAAWYLNRAIEESR